MAKAYVAGFFSEGDMESVLDDPRSWCGLVEDMAEPHFVSVGLDRRRVLLDAQEKALEEYKGRFDYLQLGHLSEADRSSALMGAGVTWSPVPGHPDRFVGSFSASFVQDGEVQEDRDEYLVVVRETDLVE